MTTADRLVAFEGITTFRDLGGYPTADGQRPDHRLAVRTVYDLRGDQRSVRNAPKEPTANSCCSA